LNLLEDAVNSVVKDIIKKDNITAVPSEKDIDIVQKITSANWDFSDNFEVEINNKIVTDGILSNFNDILRFASKYAVVSVDIPPMSSQEIDTVIGGLRRINVKMYESFRFRIRFRDIDGNQIRKLFQNIFVAQQYEYFDNIKTNINIKNGGKVIFNSEDCLIISIQQQTLDNNNTAISEFEVTFISPSISNQYLKGFGNNANYSAAFDL
jgi:hypothetical protein